MPFEHHAVTDPCLKIKILVRIVNNVFFGADAARSHVLSLKSFSFAPYIHVIAPLSCSRFPFCRYLSSPMDILSVNPC